MKPIIACLLKIGKSGTPPKKSFLGLELINGEPNLIKPTIVFVFVSLTISFISLPGAWSGENDATISNIVSNVCDCICTT